ncbi:translocation/assembly module TamB domain-containing protein [Cyclobacterium roseum]|uniref:translocation/assembly module TamB domain-containing protein n=1 Tax=Cyclobacterium roseum TaxID=2666137 RepID=UPI00139112B0|nr:translocation/assembly module TamB domain-containing protein [Cyclobacterium roseum]
MTDRRKIARRILKISGRVLLVAVLLVVGLLLLIRSPYVQGIIVGKLTNYVSGKTDTQVSIDRLFVTFRGNLFLEGLYLEDQKGDTLIFSNKLETGVELIPYLRNNEISVSRLEWDGLRANVQRDSTGKFNFDFLLDAFGGNSDTDTLSNSSTSENSQSLPEIALGPVNITDWKVHFKDALLGIDSRLELGKVALRVEKLSLDSMEFHVSKLLWEDSYLEYAQTKPFPESTEEPDSETVMPLLIVDQLSLKNIQMLYQSSPDGMDVAATIGEFLLELPEANLPEKRVLIKSVLLKNSSVDYQSQTVATETAPTDTESSAEEVSWPDWEVELAALDLEQNDLKYQVDGKNGAAGVFDPADIEINGLNLELNNLFLKAKSAGLAIKQLTFRERSGFGLNNLQLGMRADDTKFNFENLDLATFASTVSGSMELRYRDLDALVANPEASGFTVRLPTVQIGLADAYYFSPELAQDPYLQMLESKPLRAALSATGTLDRINLENFSGRWGKETRVNLKGQIDQPMNMDRLAWRLDTLTFASVEGDLDRFYPEDSVGIAYPGKVSVGLKSEGTLDAFSVRSSTDAYEANLNLDAEVAAMGENYRFDIQSRLSPFPMGELLQNQAFGNLGFELTAVGTTGPPEAIDLQVETDFTALDWNGYDYEGLSLTAAISNGQGEVELNHQDEWLDMNLLAAIGISEDDLKLDLDLDLIGADLYRLNLSSRELRAAMDLEAKWEGNPSDFTFQSQIRNGNVVLDEQALPAGDWDINLSVRPDTTNFTIESNLLQGELQANSDPGRLFQRLDRHVRQYLSDSIPIAETDSASAVRADFKLKILSTLLLDQILLPGLEGMDEGSVELSFDEAQDKLDGRVDFPYVSYAGIVVDSLGMRLTSDPDDFNFAFGLLGLESGPVSLGPTYFTGKILEDLLYLDFNALDSDKETLMHVAWDIRPGQDTLQFHIDPDSLIFNRKKWILPADNEVLIGPSVAHFRNITFDREMQKVSIANQSENAIALEFENFRMATFTSLLNADETIASGLVNGEVVIENPYGATGFLADISIRDLGLLQVPLGNLSLKASSSDQTTYDFNLALQDSGIILDLVGDYVADPSGAQLNLDLNLERLEMDVLAGLSAGTIQDGAGYLSGSFEVAGSTSSPQYQGTLQFHNTEFKIATLNAAFALSDQNIALDQDGVYLDQLTINDAQGNEFRLDGEIATPSFTNPEFDLNLQASNFRVLNSTAEDNDLFYGDAIIGANVTIQGDLNLPVVEAELTVESGTNLSFVVPETQLDIVEREGVVTFVNRQDPEDILTKRLEENINAGFSGYNIAALIKVSPESVFNLVIDQRSGDNLLVEGEADLQLNVDPNGRISLTGMYELSRGHYELSLYSLVNRRFEIQKGSTVTWAGNPLDASMDITAIYRIKTSAVGLMTATAAGGSRENMMRYRQELPFLVYLNINGELLSPLISFNLDMPEQQQGVIGGTVYSQVQQLNNREGELNRQVFSLLVLNRFFPNGDNAGGGGTTAMARSSVSQLLSGQLNSLTDNVLGGSGLELDMDLDSFQDYQSGSPQARTQLNVNASKRFLDDRLVVEVGSQIDIEGGSQSRGAENALLGNVSIEYLLTENGRYRLRGFRKNQFESFIDGQLVVTGISVIFNREFNRFYELWKGIETERNGRTLPDSPNEKSEKKPEN